jgi:hypothetical protein
METNLEYLYVDPKTHKMELTSDPKKQSSPKELKKFIQKYGDTLSIKELELLQKNPPLSHTITRIENSRHSPKFKKLLINITILNKSIFSFLKNLGKTDIALIKEVRAQALLTELNKLQLYYEEGKVSADGILKPDQIPQKVVDLLKESPAGDPPEISLVKEKFKFKNSAFVYHMHAIVKNKKMTVADKKAVEDETPFVQVKNKEKKAANNHRFIGQRNKEAEENFVQVRDKRKKSSSKGEFIGQRNKENEFLQDRNRGKKATNNRGFIGNRNKEAIPLKNEKVKESKELDAATKLENQFREDLQKINSKFEEAKGIVDIQIKLSELKNELEKYETFQKKFDELAKVEKDSETLKKLLVNERECHEKIKSITSLIEETINVLKFKKTQFVLNCTPTEGEQILNLLALLKRNQGDSDEITKAKDQLELAYPIYTFFLREMGAALLPSSSREKSSLSEIKKKYTYVKKWDGKESQLEKIYPALIVFFQQKNPQKLLSSDIAHFLASELCDLLQNIPKHPEIKTHNDLKLALKKQYRLHNLNSEIIDYNTFLKLNKKKIPQFMRAENYEALKAEINDGLWSEWGEPREMIFRQALPQYFDRMDLAIDKLFAGEKTPEIFQEFLPKSRKGQKTKKT